jgi:hypothetical protein
MAAWPVDRRVETRWCRAWSCASGVESVGRRRGSLRWGLGVAHASVRSKPGPVPLLPFPAQPVAQADAPSTRRLASTLGLMKTNDGRSKVTDADRLPPEVVKALEMGGVSGIKALRSISGLGSYEAKLAIDAYLQRHPEHPLSHQMREVAQIDPRSEQGVAWWDEIVTADPVAGEAVAFDSLPKEVVAPECYVILREKTNCESWIGEAIKACGSAMVDMNAIEFVDEERRSKDGDLSAAVLKLLRPLSREAIRALPEKLQRSLPEGVSFRVVEAAQWNEAAIPPDEMTVEYSLHEFARRGRMVSPTTSCVKLMHRHTGTLCRSTTHRRRIRNYEEALLLLASLLKEAK